MVSKSTFARFTISIEYGIIVDYSQPSASAMTVTGSRGAEELLQKRMIACAKGWIQVDRVT